MGTCSQNHQLPTPTMSDAAAPKAKKATKPKAPAAHPKYSVMIAAAITALKSRTGSSRQAIIKYIVANYKVDAAKAAVQVRLALKRGVAKVENPKKVKKAKKPAKKAAKEPAKKAAKKA